MHTRFSRLPFLVGAAAIAFGCNSHTPAGGCKTNADCTGGSVCAAGGQCKVLCSNDLGCPTGNVCRSGLCVKGTATVPVIDAVVGNGSNACVTVGPTGVPCLGDGIIVSGKNLTGAKVSWSDANNQTVDLTVRSATDTQLEAVLPTDVQAGNTYVLALANAAGTAQTNVQLLQGEPGNMTGDQIIDRINTNGTTTFVVARLPPLAPAINSAGVPLDVSVVPIARGVRPAASDPGDCTSAAAGALYLDSTAKRLLVCDGTSYRALGFAPFRDGSSQAKAAKSCRAIIDDGLAAGDGIYWLDPGLDGNAFQAYCDMTTDGGGWTMVFKLNKGGTSVDPWGLWVGQPLNEGQTSLLTAGPSTSNYMNRIVSSYWNRQRYELHEARIDFYVASTIVQSITFGVEGTSKTNWMQRNHIIVSPWTDIETAASNFFSIAGDTPNQRYFFANELYNTCAGDSGWFVAAAGRAGGCTWEGTTPTVTILVSNQTTASVWQSTNTTAADAMLIFVR